MSWDDFGGDPAPGNASDATALGDSFGSTADAAQAAHDRLKRLDDGVDDAIWKGDSADAFKESIKKAPEHLAKLHESYASAAEALHGYAGSLVELQRQACTLLPQLESAKGQADTAQSTHDSAPPEQQGSAQTTVDQAKTYLGNLTTQVQQIREDHKKAEDRAIGRLETAHDQGIKNDSWWQHALHRLADIADYVAFALAVIAIVIVVCVLLTNPLGWAGLAAAFGAASGWFLASTAAAAVAVGAKWALLASGDDEYSWKRLSFDTALCVVGFLGAGPLKGVGKFGSFTKVTSAGAGYLEESTTSLARFTTVIESEGFTLTRVLDTPVTVVTRTPVELFVAQTKHVGEFSQAFDKTVGLFTIGDYQNSHPDEADPVLLESALLVPGAAPALALGVGFGHGVDKVLGRLGIE